MEGGLRGLLMVFSAFMVQVLAFGNYACIGIYTVHLLDVFDNDTVGVSIIASVHFCTLLCCGPLCSFMLTKISYRKVSMIGSFLVFVGIVCTPLIVSIPAMSVFFGIFAGLGGCLTYIPSHLMAGLYYDKHRPLAVGVATAGTGMGAVVIPLIVGLLIEEFTWRGSLIVLAGIDLHLFVFALLMVPPEKSTEKLQAFSHLSLLVDDGYNLKHITDHEVYYNKQTNQEHTDKNHDQRHNEEKEQEHNQNLDDFKEINIEDNTPEEKLFLITNENVSFEKISEDCLHIKTKDKYSNVNYEDNHEKIDLYAEEDVDTKEIIRKPRALTVDSEVELKSPAAKVKMSTFQLLKDHLSLFSDYKFNFYILSTFLWSLTTTAFLTFCPEVIVRKGHTAIQAAFIFTFWGIGQTVGCLLISVFGNFVGNRLLIFILSNALTGLFLAVTPFVSTFVELSAVLTCTGLAYGGILGMYMIVMVDLVGVEYMEMGLGYLMMASGFGCFTGPPVGGALSNVFGGFTEPFVIFGAFTVVSGLIMLVAYIPKLARILGPANDDLS